MLDTLNPEVFKGDSPEGGIAKFVIVDGVGLKLFRHEFERDTSLATQSALNCYGLAPTPGDKFDVVIGARTMYGHATEVAETVVDMTTVDGRVQSAYDRMYEKYRGRNDERLAVNLEMQRTLSRLRQLGLKWADDHPGNYGWIDGHMVIIDTLGVKFPGTRLDKNSGVC